jgi:predicted MFS family arabinose efflux permease
MGIAGGGYHPAASPVIWGAVPPDRRGRALGVHLAGGGSSHFAAPLLGVLLAGLWGWRGAFLAVSVPVLAFGFVLYALLGRGATGRGAQDRPAGAAGAAPAPVSMVEIVAMLVLSTSISATVTSVLSFVPLFIVDTHGASEAVAAGYLSLAYAAGFVAGPLAGYLSDRFGPLRLLLGVGLLLPPTLLLLAVAPFGLPLAALLLGIQTLMYFRGPTSEAFLVANIPQRVRSTVLGLYFFTGMEAGGILTPLVGRLIDVRGFAAGFTAVAAVAGALVVLCGAVLLRTGLTRARERAAR